MRPIFLIVVILISKIAISQESSQQQFKLKSSYKKEMKDFRKSLPAAFLINYKNDTTLNRYISLSPELVFKHSATIFDMTRIVLFKDGTFYCYTHGCLREGSSAGNYTIKDDTLTLTSSYKVFKKLKKNSDFKGLKFVFIDLIGLKFLIKKEELLAVK